MRVRPIVLALSLFSLAAVGAACSSGGKGGAGTPTPSPSPTPEPTPVVSSVAPATGIAGTEVTVSGENFGETQGASVVRFGAAVATTVQSWSASSIVAVVPDEAYPGNREVTVETTGGLSNAVPFSVILPPAFYVNDDTSPFNFIEAFSVDQTGVPVPLAGSPHTLTVAGSTFGGFPGALALNAPTRRVFTTSQATIHSWNIAPRTGALSLADTLDLGANQLPFGIAASADGTRVFAADGDNGTVHVADVAPDGTLTQVAGSPFATGEASGPTNASLSNDGAWLFVNLDVPAQVHSFAVSADGTLTQAGNSPYALAGTAYYVEMAPDADRLYATSRFADLIQVFDVDTANGDLVENVALRATVGSPESIAFTADGSRAFVVNATSIHVYDVDAANGELTPVVDSPFMTDYFSLTGIRVSADGTRVFVDDQYDTDNLAVYEVSPAGVPTEIVGSPFPLQTDSLSSGMALTF